MASIIGVETLQHTNGTTAATIQSDGTLYPTGHVIQVVNTTNRNTASTSSAEWKAWDISASITPKSTSSKILVMVHLPNNYVGGSGKDWFVRLLRGTTDLFGSSGNTAVGSVSTYSNQANCQGARMAIDFQYYDSPSTTSQITYTCQAYNDTGSTMYLNYSTDRGEQSITLMEIAG